MSETRRILELEAALAQERLSHARTSDELAHAQRVANNAVKEVFAELIKVAERTALVRDGLGSLVMEDGRSDYTYDTIAEWVYAQRYRMTGERE